MIKSIHGFFFVLLVIIVGVIALTHSTYFIFIPFVVMFVYCIGKLVNSITSKKSEEGKKDVKDYFWVVKSYCYFAVFVGTLADYWLKETSTDKPVVTTMVAAIAFIEFFDILFKEWLEPKVETNIPKITSYFKLFKPKLNSFLKTLYITVFGYRLCDLRK